ncbi:mannose-6-phosphate isomerase, class I [Nonomuraea dietziae]|uniref:mannose-6-phosphate isomerase, class I n=1 Tax=Nonomuraea dietziae TaxID=65515 RepID=UPI0031E0C70F
MTELLSNPVKHYAWGSHTAIATLTGRPSPSPEPEAEMWLGAHPSGPSLLVERGRTLDEAIADDPEGELGAETLARFGARLPYLLKLIAVDSVLSLQVHPSAEQAEAGHARGAYVDAYPKPELICALTPFSGLAGFRAPQEAARLLAELEVAELEPVVARLRAGDTAGALRLLLEWPERKRLVEAVVAAAERLGHDLVTRLARAVPRRPRRAGPSADEPARPAARRGAVPRRGGAARLRERVRRGDHGRLGQRAARRADQQADRRRRTAARHRRRRPAAAGRGRRRALQRAGPRVRARPPRGS